MGFTKMTDEEREVYSAVARKLCGPDYNDNILFPFQIALDLNKAKVFIEMPGSAEDIAEKTGFTPQFIEDTMKELYHKGYAVLTRRSGYQPARSVIQVVDTGPIQKYADELGDEYFKSLYSSMAGMPTLALASMAIPLLKVIPHYKALEMSGFKEEEILPEENLNEQMKKASSIGAHYCGCRRAVWGAEEREEAYVCLCFDYMAEYEVKRGSARMLSYEEVIELEENLAKTWNAITPQNGTYLDALCNCNYEAQCVWEEMEMAGMPMKDGVAPSRYQAVVDPEKCISCQDCVLKCKAEAFTMIQYEGEKKFRAWADPDRCMGCGCCVINCKGKACSMITVRPPEFIESADRPAAGRYDTPDKYVGILAQSAVGRKARQKQWAEMEEQWCLERGINRDPYRMKR
ncbi:ATP-binding protein [Thermodesulfobacteriota bacterium]